MSKSTKTIIAVIILVLFIVASILVITRMTKNNTIKSLNELLADEAVQNEILTAVIEDSVKGLNLGKNGEYRLQVQADNIVNLLSKELLLDQSFLKNVEVESNEPVEIYTIVYSYDEKTMQLTIDIKGMYSDLEIKTTIYQLSNKNNNVEFKKINSKITPYTGEIDNGDREESVYYTNEE